VRGLSKSRQGSARALWRYHPHKHWARRRASRGRRGGIDAHPNFKLRHHLNATTLNLLSQAGTLTKVRDNLWQEAPEQHSRSGRKSAHARRSALKKRSVRRSASNRVTPRASIRRRNRSPTWKSPATKRVSLRVSISTTLPSSMANQVGALATLAARCDIFQVDAFGYGRLQATSDPHFDPIPAFPASVSFSAESI
jgi:hypothetical protein